MPMTRLDFTVYGKPEPAGSKRAFALRKGGVPTGKVAVTDDNPKSRGWKAEVADVAAATMAGSATPLVLDACGLALTFYMARPKGHYGTGRNADRLKDSAPAYPVVKPDATKLVRGVEDAMSGIVWRDDAQVVEQFVSKQYADDCLPGVRVIVWTL